MPLIFQPQKYVVRLYILNGYQIVPKDLNGSSDPYIIVKNGTRKENIINDVSNAKKRTLKPDFYHVRTACCYATRSASDHSTSAMSCPRRCRVIRSWRCKCGITILWGRMT